MNNIMQLKSLIKSSKSGDILEFNVDSVDGIEYEGIVYVNGIREGIKFTLWNNLNLQNTIHSIMLTFGFSGKITYSDGTDWITIKVKLRNNSLSQKAENSVKGVAGVYFQNIQTNGKNKRILFSIPNLNGYIHPDDRHIWKNNLLNHISHNINKDSVEFISR